MEQTFSREVRGLKGGTVYHFRAIATNSVDTSYGTDRTFHTEALSAEAHQALGKAYSLGRHGLMIKVGSGTSRQQALGDKESRI